jgi:hypothetical protein
MFSHADDFLPILVSFRMGSCTGGALKFCFLLGGTEMHCNKTSQQMVVKQYVGVCVHVLGAHTTGAALFSGTQHSTCTHLASITDIT